MRTVWSARKVAKDSQIRHYESASTHREIPSNGDVTEVDYYNITRVDLSGGISDEGEHVPDDLI